MADYRELLGSKTYENEGVEVLRYHVSAGETDKYETVVRHQAGDKGSSFYFDSEYAQALGQKRCVDQYLQSNRGTVVRSHAMPCAGLTKDDIRLLAKKAGPELAERKAAAMARAIRLGGQLRMARGLRSRVIVVDHQ